MLAELNISAIGMAGNASGLFQGILPFALLAVLVVVVVHLIWTLTHRRPAVSRSPWGWWAWLVYLGTLASVAVLGVTSFVAMIRFGALGGWWLFIHMFGAGTFTVALPVLALTGVRRIASAVRPNRPATRGKRQRRVFRAWRRPCSG